MLELSAEDMVSTSFVMRLRTSPTVTLSKNLSGSLFIFWLMLVRMLHASFCMTVIMM